MQQVYFVHWLFELSVLASFLQPSLAALFSVHRETLFDLTAQPLATVSRLAGGLFLPALACFIFAFSPSAAVVELHRPRPTVHIWLSVIQVLLERLPTSSR